MRTNVMLQCLDTESRCIFILGTMFRIDNFTSGLRLLNNGKLRGIQKFPYHISCALRRLVGLAERKVLCQFINILHRIFYIHHGFCGDLLRCHIIRLQRIYSAEFEKLLQTLMLKIGKFDDSVLHNNPKDLTFKLVRDTRFSHDKSPYNPAFRAHISSCGKLPVPVGYYLMITPQGLCSDNR